MVERRSLKPLYSLKGLSGFESQRGCQSDKLLFECFLLITQIGKRKNIQFICMSSSYRGNYVRLSIGSQGFEFPRRRQ